MLAVFQRVQERQDDAAHRDEGADLDHRPRRPVQRHEVLAVTELQREQREHFHDHDDDGDEHASRREEDASGDRPLLFGAVRPLSVDFD